MFSCTLSPSPFIFRASGSVKSRIGERGERKRKGGGKYGARCCDDDDGDNGVGGGTGREREGDFYHQEIRRTYEGRHPK